MCCCQSRAQRSFRLLVSGVATTPLTRSRNDLWARDCAVVHFPSQFLEPSLITGQHTRFLPLTGKNREISKQSWSLTRYIPQEFPFERGRWLSTCVAVYSRSFLFVYGNLLWSRGDVWFYCREKKKFQTVSKIGQ